MRAETRCRVCSLGAGKSIRKVRGRAILCKDHWRRLQQLLDDLAIGLQRDIWKPDAMRIDEYRVLVYCLRQSR